MVSIRIKNADESELLIRLDFSRSSFNSKAPSSTIRIKPIVPTNGRIGSKLGMGISNQPADTEGQYHLIVIGLRMEF